jgi:hypothetical protein
LGTLLVNEYQRAIAPNYDWTDSLVPQEMLDFCTEEAIEDLIRWAHRSGLCSNQAWKWLALWKFCNQPVDGVWMRARVLGQKLGIATWPENIAIIDGMIRSENKRYLRSHPHAQSFHFSWQYLAQRATTVGLRPTLVYLRLALQCDGPILEAIHLSTLKLPLNPML